MSNLIKVTRNVIGNNLADMPDMLNTKVKLTGEIVSTTKYYGKQTITYIIKIIPEFEIIEDKP
jgi:hypothetical protein